MKASLLLATLTLAAVTTFTQAAQPAAYTVKKGDSIERIANRNGVSASSLARANGLKPGAIIHPGQQLKIPGRAAAPAATSTTASTPKPATQGKRYSVNQGDTFYSISRRHGMSVAALMAANPGVKANALRPGMTLNLGKASAPAPATRKPASTPAVAAAKAPEKKTVVETPKPAAQKPAAVASATPSPAPTQVTKAGDMLPDVPGAPPSVPLTTAETSPAPAPPAEPEAATAPLKKEIARPIVIDGEMTYGQFALKHNTSPARLNELNGLDLTDSTLLAKGSELYIPAQP
ncbi:MAG: LysM peptidoglycan-binding domain-containing protein [Luteolibacter sp.]